MLAWVVRWRRKGCAWLPLPLLAACASVLGIEQRQQDSAANYPADGYEGCRPGVSCTGCLAVHELECTLRSNCASALTSDDCAGCVCENCTDSLVDCQSDSGCSAIWACIKQTRCDLTGRGGVSCVTACGATIEAHGGVAGEAFRAAADVRTCATTSACFSCLAPEPEPVATCTKASGCASCADCFHKCICSGEKFGACKELCGSEAPAESCTPDNSCMGCSTCFDLCTCGGAGFEQCISACQENPGPAPVETCTPATGCEDCEDCASTCACNNGDANECESLCAPPPADDQCIDAARSGGDTCGGCSSALARCSCPGTALEECMAAQGALNCCGDGCAGEMSTCVCEQRGSADSCAEQSNHCDDADACSKCACRNCPGKYALCQETQGCPNVLECMRATHCKGSGCRERCGDVASSSGGGAAAFDAAEALWACDRANACECESQNGPAPVTLCAGPDGNVECSDYQSSNVAFSACCPGAAGTGTTTSQSAGSGNTSSACGLALQPHFPGAGACEPFGQKNQHRLLLETCPDRTIAEPPYNGAMLAGCCHAPDNTCGVFDDVTGLGCLRSTVFGIQAEGCGGLL